MATFELGKNAFFGTYNKETGEITRIELKSPVLIHFTQREDRPPIKPIVLSDFIGSFTITVKVPYSFWWRNTWQRGFNKAVSISPIPVGNPRDN